MPPRMRTQSAGRLVAKSRGGGTGGRVGRGGGKGRRPKEGNDEHVDDLNVKGMTKNLLLTMLAQFSNRGNVGNQSGNVVNEIVQENVGNVLMNGNQVSCSYKEFLACNPKEYDGKGGPVVLTSWIEKIESVHDMSGCSIDQKVKYTAGSFMGKALTWWNSQICTLSQGVAVSMSWNDFKFMMIEEFCPSHEMQKLESEMWNPAMVGDGHDAYTDRFHELARLVPYLVTPESRMIERENVGEPSKDKNGRDDNKRTRTGNAFATTVNTDCRSVPRNVNHVNAKNPTVKVCYEYGSADHVRSAYPRLNRAQGQKETIQTKLLLITGVRVMETKGTKLGLGNSCIEPIDLGFRYEIEIASGQLVEIDKVIKGCKLEIEGHVFDIDLIPFGHGSFDEIIYMDWLSNHKVEMRQLKSTKAKDKQQREIVVVRDFTKVFLDDLSGLPSVYEIKFRIKLIPGVVPVAKSPYRLAPSELEELSRKLKEPKTKIMPPRMRTQSAGRLVAESRGGGTGGRVARGGGRGNDQGLGANGGVKSVNGNFSNRGNVGNQSGNVVNEIVQENVGNVLMNGNQVSCSYKEFLACNPKEYDEEFCPSHEMQKLESEMWNPAMVGDGHDAYSDRFHELARLVPYLVTPESRMIERTESIKKVKKRENVGEPSKDKNGRDDNKRTRTGNAFATTVNIVCYEYGCADHVRSACPRLNRAQGPEGNRPNQVAANNGGQGHGNQRNQARAREFMLEVRKLAMI
nr:reverse transcriptase domain-containing protein [Tanacetum cinerariifolium]